MRPLFSLGARYGLTSLLFVVKAGASIAPRAVRDNTHVEPCNPRYVYRRR